MALELADEPDALDFPQTDHFIAAGQQAPAIRREVHGLNAVNVVVETPQLLAALHVPQNDHAAIAG